MSSLSKTASNLAGSGTRASLPRRTVGNAPTSTSLPLRDSKVTVGPKASIKPSKSSGGALPKRELLMIMTQLSIMLRSGVDLADAVRSISMRATSDRVRQVMERLYTHLEQGTSLSQALELDQQKFGQVTVALVSAGEASGTLPDVLTRLSKILRDEMRLRSSLRSALGYPAVLLTVTLGVLAGMVFFVLPQFAGIFESSNVTVPWTTQLMLDGGQLARQYWWALLGALAAAIIGLVTYCKSPGGRHQLDKLLLRLPLFGSIGTPLLAGRLFRLQGAMLDSGVPLLQVLKLTKSSVGNTCYTDLVERVEQSVVKGEGFSTVLQDNPLVPAAAADMIATGEANGQLGSVLQTVGEFYESEGEEKLRDSVKIAEPVIIIGLGIVVGGIVLSVMLPMLDITTGQGL
jgi:type II secretory pathway component PulF